MGDSKIGEMSLSIDYKKVALSAALGTGFSLVLGASFDGSVNLLGMEIPQALAFGAVSGLGTLLGELIAAMPNVSNSSWVTLFKNYMQPVFSGASTLVLGLILIDSSMDDYMVLLQQFGLGFASNLVADYIIKGMPAKNTLTDGSSSTGK